MAVRNKAQFEIKDMIVMIFCPDCGAAQNSPHHPGSKGWGPRDVDYIGTQGKIYCRRCHQPFLLPASLFRLMPPPTEEEERAEPPRTGVPRTERQKEILEYIKGFIERKGHQPTYMQIGRHFGITQKATVAKHIGALERRGLLTRNWEGTQFTLIVHG